MEYKVITLLAAFNPQTYTKTITLRARWFKPSVTLTESEFRTIAAVVTEYEDKRLTSLHKLAYFPA